MSTLQQIIETRLANLEAAYNAEKAKIQADLVGLADSGWLAKEESELKAFVTQSEDRIHNWIAVAKAHLGL